MDNEKKWAWVWTGKDLLAGFLKSELEDQNIEVLIKSETESGRLAGFGTSRLAQVYVRTENYEKVKTYVEDFEGRQL